MPRRKTQWFRWRDEYSYDLGVWMQSGIMHSTGSWRGESKEIIGRSGDVWVTDETYGTIQLKVKLACHLSVIEKVAYWLQGESKLIFSWSPFRAYEARIVDAIEFKQGIIGADPVMYFDVTFMCQPYKLMIPEMPKITITENGATITNIGTAPSRPKVTINGSGDFNVTIGEETIYFYDIENGIIVDSEIMDALSLDETSLLNNKIDGRPWLIRPGLNHVSWELGDGATLTSINILPRWRYR